MVVSMSVSSKVTFDWNNKRVIVYILELAKMDTGEQGNETMVTNKEDAVVLVTQSSSKILGRPRQQGEGCRCRRCASYDTKQKLFQLPTKVMG